MSSESLSHSCKQSQLAEWSSSYAFLVRCSDFVLVNNIVTNIGMCLVNLNFRFYHRGLLDNMVN